MERTLWIAGAAMAGLSVAIGAFGAHALRARLEPARIATFETAVQYHMLHALALLAAAALMGRVQSQNLLLASGWLFAAGIFLFSGSLYALAVTGITWLGAITPLGGVAFIGGWLCLGMAAWKM
ncbi:membrane protein [Anaerolineae bacterium]|nr:membrane protein [Anaerolineae bacterium]